MIPLMFLACACNVLAAADTPRKPYTSAYYQIESDLPAQRVQQIGKVMDSAGKEYDRRFSGFSGKVRQKLKLKVYATHEGFVEAMRKTTDATKAQAMSGYFLPVDETVYAFESPQLDATLRHECFHQFVHFVVGGKLDTWVNEGLAEYFEAAEVDPSSGAIRLGSVDPQRVAALAAAKQAKSLMPVDKLMNISGQDWHENMGSERAAGQYAQAWVLCHFLVHGDGGKYQKLFDDYLRLVDQHLDGGTAFKRVFGDDLGPLQEKYSAYVDHLIATTPPPQKKAAPEGAKKPDDR